MPDIARKRRLPREYVRGFTCPSCGSGPQTPCVANDGQPRTSNHSARVAVASASLSKHSASPVTVWVPGVCPDGPGRGGWAALLRIGKRELEVHGGASLTSEPQMLLTAVIESIKAFPDAHARLTVNVQSEQIVTALRKGWPAVWKKRGWSNRDGMPVKNRDLWELLACETERHDIRWRPFTSDGGPEQTRVTAIAAGQR